MYARALAFAALLGAASSSIAAVDIVDDSGTSRNGKVGYFSAIAAKGGQVGISYYCEDDAGNNPPEMYTLRFAWPTDGHTWHWVTVDSGGGETSIARGSDGFYQIVYSSWTGMGWATGAETNWTLASVPIPGNMAPINISMVLDENNRPHVSYLNSANAGDRSLRYTYFDGVEWVAGATEILGTNLWAPTNGFSSTMLALDPPGTPNAGTPHVIYAVPTDSINAYGEIRYASLVSGAWSHVSLNQQGVDPCLRIGTDGVPRVVFRQDDDLIYGYKPGSNWIFESLAADIPGLGGVGSVTLALSAQNVPFVSFAMSASEDMYIATRTPNGWTATFIDGDGQSDGNLLLGRYGIGLDVDDNGVPHTSYSAIQFYGGGWRTDLRYAGPGGGGPPPCVTITRSPASAHLCNGESASFSIAASGTEPLRYQWQWLAQGGATWLGVVEGLNYDPVTQLPAFVAQGAQADTLDLPGSDIAPDLQCQFRAVVSSDCGSATSQPATLALSGGVTILTQPQDAATCPSGPAWFSVEADGGALDFQWQVEDPDSGDWVDLIEGENELLNSVVFFAAGVQAPDLSLRDFFDDDVPPHRFSGTLPIRCRVGGSCGVTTSDTAELTVCPADFNCDAQVDFFDYLDFVAAFSDETEAADFNLDGQVDFFDYLDFAMAFGAGC